MKKIHFVGDGELDGACLPCLVAKVVGNDIDDSFAPWARLNQARGFSRKLLFAIFQAKDAGAEGLVAVVDKDKAKTHDRLKDLRDGRERHRENHAPFPTALGEANPHGEAWLLDDPQAIRQVLSLQKGIPVPVVGKTRNPKRDLKELIRQSSRAAEGDASLYREIAEAIDLARCAHAKQSGLEAFCREVEHEFSSR